MVRPAVRSIGGAGVGCIGGSLARRGGASAARCIVVAFVTVTEQRRCRWCGRPFDVAPAPGRPRLYCRRSCRQRDYEARRRAADLGIGEESLIVRRADVEAL